MLSSVELIADKVKCKGWSVSNRAGEVVVVVVGFGFYLACITMG